MIDEAVDLPGIVTKKQLAADWDKFRSLYPLRPFCLLQPRGWIKRALQMPDAFRKDNNTILKKVNRDQGNPDETSDWFDACNLHELRARGVTAVALFVDISGSVVLDDISASHNQFMEKLSESGLELKNATYNGDENWILPHIRDYI